MSNIDWSDLGRLTPIGVVLGASLIVVFLDLALSHKDRYILPWAALTGVVLGLIASIQSTVAPEVTTVWFRDLNAAALNAKSLILGGAFCLDHFGLAIWIIACVAGGLSILCSPPAVDEDSTISTGEYYGLTLLAVAGMMLLAVSHDFLTLIVSLEIMSIATYILTGSSRESIFSNEAGIKYLVLGAFSTAFMLMGIAFYYGAFGSVSLTPNEAFQALQMSNPIESSRESFIFLSMGFIFVGAFFKIGATPFHFWIPDVYEGAPTAVTGLMAVGVKAAAFAVVARLMFETFGANQFHNDFTPLLSWIAVATMAVGNILAMRQNSVKRMLAYSGIAHTGYLLLAFLMRDGDASSEVMAEHVKAVVYYLLVYGVMTIGAFGVVSLVREDGKPLETFDAYAGLSKENPGIALCMTMFMLSLAGMPPFGGFFAKFMIFRGAVSQGYVLAATLGILTSVASLYYYLRVVVAMYMSPAGEPHAKEAVPSPVCRYAWSSSLLIYVAGAATLAIGLGLNYVSQWIG